ncbi:MAG: hypothetical protein AAB036_06210 [Elusimicrobiota bacterium]
MPDNISLSDVKLFDVLRNALNGELGSVMGIAGDKLDLVDQNGTIVRYKFGGHFSRADEDESIAFRAGIQALRRARALASPRKKRKSSAAPKSRAKRSARRRG